jgi:hypothetical protein
VTLALTVSAPGVSLVIPSLITNAGAAAAQHTLEFFTARIPNAHTREAYGRAVARFCVWCDVHGVTLLGVTSPLVAAYLQLLQQTLQTLSPASAKQHLAGLRHWMDWLTERGVLAVNPAASVRGPRHVVHEGKTPVLEREEARLLLASIDGTDVVSLRDKALLSVMLFSTRRTAGASRTRPSSRGMPRRAPRSSTIASCAKWREPRWSGYSCEPKSQTTCSNALRSCALPRSVQRRPLRNPGLIG